MTKLLSPILLASNRSFFDATVLSPEFFYSPLYLLLIYLTYIVVKPQSKEDEIFALDDRLSFESVAGRIEALGEVNNMDYSRFVETIQGYYADRQITHEELEKIEELINRSYYLGFKSRWIVIKKMDSVFILLGITTAIVVAACISIYFQGNRDYSFVSIVDMILGMTWSIIPGVITSYFVLRYTSAFVSVCSMIFPKRGSVTRARISSEEFLLAIDPRISWKRKASSNSEDEFWESGLS